jgi:hypothetical protein
MASDLIVEEIRRLRDEYAKRFNYDIKAMFEDLKKEQRASGRKVVSLSTRPTPSPATRRRSAARRTSRQGKGS